MLLLLALAGHLAFGLQPATAHEIRHNGAAVDTVESSAGGSIRFLGELDGRWDIVPVGSVPIPPIDCPDLIVTAVTITTPCGPGEWRATFSVKNQGRADAVSTFNYRVQTAAPGGTLATVCQANIPSLAAGATAGPFSCRLAATVPTSPPGDWTVAICADATGTVAESDEGNNCW